MAIRVYIKTYNYHELNANYHKLILFSYLILTAYFLRLSNIIRIFALIKCISLILHGRELVVTK